MKILRLVYEWPPPWDGLAPGIYELTRAQIKLGHRVTVFCGGGFKKEVQPRKRLDLSGVHVYRFPRALKLSSLFLTTSPAVLLGYLFLKLTGRGPDLVHGHGHITCCFNIYKFFLGWLDKTPYVLHLHITAAGRQARLAAGDFPKPAEEKSQALGNLLEPDSGESAGFFPRQPQEPAEQHPLDFWTKYFEWPLHKFSDWLGVRVADKVICVSSRVMEEAIKFYGARLEKLVVVENGVNTDLFVPNPDNASRITYNVLYVGALNPRKNVDLLVEAMRFLPDFRLTIVGRGAKDYEDKLHRLVESLELQERVKFEGYVEYPRLPNYYRDAAIFVLPSSYEGLPKVVLEALASGVCVLASGFEIAEEICGLEFLDDLDPAAIAERIQRVTDSSVEVDVLRVQELYSWERKAREAEEIYSKICLNALRPQTG